MWQLRIGSIITLRVLKWPAGTIRDCHCQLSRSASDWTTESDSCKEREPSAPTTFNIAKHKPTSEYGCVCMMAYEEGFRIAIEIVLCTRESTDPRGYQGMDGLGTLRKPADSAGI